VLVVNSGVPIFSNLEPELGNGRGGADRDAGLGEVVPKCRVGRSVGDANGCGGEGMRTTSTAVAVSTSPEDFDSSVGSSSSIKSPELRQRYKTRMMK
jgi:hypothetical protein